MDSKDAADCAFDCLDYLFDYYYFTLVFLIARMLVTKTRIIRCFQLT